MDALQKTIAKLQNAGVEIFPASQVKQKLGTIPTGSLLLDDALDCGGGYPMPKIVQIYGPPAAGKSLLALMTEAYVTRQGYRVLHCDLENAHTREEDSLRRRTVFGTDLDNVIDVPGQEGDAVLETVVSILKSRDIADSVRLIIVDSIGALTSAKTLSKDLTEGYIDDTARLVNRFCKYVNALNKHAVVLMLAHTGANIGSLSPKPIVKGGSGVQYFSSVRLEVRGTPVPESRDSNGFYHRHKMDIRVEKNKVGRPGGLVKDLTFDFDLGGFDTYSELVGLAIKKGVVVQNAAIYTIPGSDFKIKGREHFNTELQGNEPLFRWLFETVTGKTPEDYFKCS